MKQLKFFAGMAAVMFAASCANDEIQPTAPVMPSEERPAADFVLSVNEIQDETRAVFGNGSL